MNQQQIQQIIDSLNKYGAAAWNIYLRQVKIEIGIDIAMLLFTWSLTTIFAISLYKAYKKENSNYFDVLDHPIAFWGSCISGISTVIITVMALSELPTLIFNPQYYVIKDILGK